MDVVAHCRVGQAVNPEHRCKEFLPVSNPLSSMFVVIAGVFVQSTEKRLPHAALHTVDDLDFMRIEVLTTSLSGHRDSPSQFLFSFLFSFLFIPELMDGDCLKVGCVPSGLIDETEDGELANFQILHYP